MFLKYFFPLCLLMSNFAWASEFMVVSRVNTFKITYDEGQIVLKGPQYNLSLKKNDCNAEIIKSFMKKMSRFKRSVPMKVFKDSESFKFKMDGKDYFESYKTRGGVFILNLPKEVQRMKLEEKYLCGPATSKSSK